MAKSKSTGLTSWLRGWIAFSALVAVAGCAPFRTSTAPGEISQGAQASGPGADAPALPQPESRRVRRELPSGTLQANRLSAALLGRLTVWTRHDGRRVLSRHCRTAEVPCETRVHAFAELFLAAGNRFDLDPLLLAAIALRESNLDASAVGRLGTAGIMQLHPRGVGREEPFVTDAAYRRRCLKTVDACQGSVVERASRALAESLEHCGSLEAALGRYATGRCTETPSYSEKVHAEIRALQDALGR